MLKNMTEAERAAFYHERQKKAAITRKANHGEDAFVKIGKLGGTKSRPKPKEIK
jgi:hypothetical protein